MRERYEWLKVIAESRRSVRSFTDESVGDEEIDRILAVARTAPYGSGRTNWDIVVVRDRTTIGELAADVRRSIESLNLRDDLRADFLDYASNFTIFERAPVLFIPVFRIPVSLPVMFGTMPPELENWERDTAVKSISCVGMMILLAAESLGLGACYMTGPLVAERDIARRCGVKPGRSIGAIIPVGHKQS